MGVYIALQPLRVPQVEGGVIPKDDEVPAEVISSWEPMTLDKMVLAGCLYYEPEADETYTGPQANVPFGAVGAPVLPNDPQAKIALTALSRAGLDGYSEDDIVALREELDEFALQGLEGLTRAEILALDNMNARTYRLALEELHLNYLDNVSAKDLRAMSEDYDLEEAPAVGGGAPVETEAEESEEVGASDSPSAEPEESQDETEADELEFDPADYNVKDVVDYAAEYPELAEAILDAEEAGLARASAIKQLQAILVAEDDPEE